MLRRNASSERPRAFACATRLASALGESSSVIVIVASFRARQVNCVNGGDSIPGRLNGPERRVGLCGDATRAPTQGPGFRKCECSSPSGPGILARKRKISGFGAEPHPETLFFRILRG